MLTEAGHCVCLVRLAGTEYRFRLRGSALLTGCVFIFVSEGTGKFTETGFASSLGIFTLGSSSARF
jgi:hypothetical protein